jgi:ABC-type transport system involved in multi-copper enzyme maturation permease subunit
MLKHPLLAIARKDLSDARRDRFLLILTGCLALAALVSLITGAMALSAEVASYHEAKALLLSLGKPIDSIVAPEFHPLKLLRGAIEQIEILGAVLGILAGFRTAASERGRQTLALIMTRPVKHWHFLAGKYLAGALLLSFSFLTVFALATLALQGLSGVGLVADDLLRIFIVWGTASLYVLAFYSLTFVLTLGLKHPAHALLIAFTAWLLVVLVAPQIGDTLDPDNQVAGGVFKQLSVPKAEQDRILAGYAAFETIRNGIEASSITKHFERFSFAVLGIKDSYTGKPLGPILTEKQGDFLWILFTSLGLTVLLLVLPIHPNRLTKE